MSFGFSYKSKRNSGGFFLAIAYIDTVQQTLCKSIFGKQRNTFWGQAGNPMNQKQELFFATDSAECLLGRGDCSLAKGARKEGLSVEGSQHSPIHIQVGSTCSKFVSHQLCLAHTRKPTACWVFAEMQFAQRTKQPLLRLSMRTEDLAASPARRTY